MNAWREALRTLPSPNLMKETDKILKAQFDDGLKNAEERSRERLVFKPQTISKDDAPWVKAIALENQYASERKMSSVSAFSSFHDLKFTYFQQRLLSS